MLIESSTRRMFRDFKGVTGDEDGLVLARSPSISQADLSGLYGNEK
jgi:hypothetical protein